jgi:hypothetical protein
MISIQREHLEIGHEIGLIDTILSNGWIVKQRFDWYVDYDGVQLEYDADAMEVIGAEKIEEYSAEELAALEACEKAAYDLKTEIMGSKYYRKAEKEFKESLDRYAYYGVSHKDFCSF